MGPPPSVPRPEKMRVRERPPPSTAKPKSQRSTPPPNPSAERDAANNRPARSPRRPKKERSWRGLGTRDPTGTRKGDGRRRRGGRPRLADGTNGCRDDVLEQGTAWSSEEEVFGYGRTGAASEAAPKPPAEDAASGEKQQGLKRRRRRAGRSQRGARAFSREDAPNRKGQSKPRRRRPPTKTNGRERRQKGLLEIKKETKESRIHVDECHLHCLTVPLKHGCTPPPPRSASG